MPVFNRLVAVLVTVLMIAPVPPLAAKTRKGDHYLGQGRMHEEKKEWDAALEDYEKALSQDPGEMVYQMAAQKARFQAAQMHIDLGLKARTQGLLGDALLEFQKAFAINPASGIAQQEILTTQQMIERERKRLEETGKAGTAEQKSRTPAQQQQKEDQDQIDRMLPMPELKPLNPELINLKMNNQPTKILFETVGKVAGVNVLFDPDYQAPAKNLSVDFNSSTVQQALDYVAVLTHSYWKPLSPNTIFITNDNPNKRRDYAEMVCKTFYLNNTNSPQQLQEIVNAVRTITEATRMVAYSAQNAIIVRGEADQVALAGKIIKDLDKPVSEVVVDVLVMEASSVFTRQLSAAIASGGLSVPINFNPRTSLQVQSSTSSTSSTSGTTTPISSSTTNTSTNTSTTASSTTGTAIPLSNLSHLSSADFSTTLPSALLQAALSDTKTKVMQAPQLRAVDNQKAELKIGEREPTATGSFQPGVGGVGINPLVNTQFNYIDVGVNVTLTPRVHENGDISMHVELDISNITGTVNLGGINEPIIGQRKVTHDVRMHEGEVSLLAGLVTQQDTNSVTGIPGLSSIPILKWLFQGQSVDRERDEIMIALIPHIVRRPDLSADNLKGIAVGNGTAIKLNYAPLPAEAILPPNSSAGKPAPPASVENPVVLPPATAPAPSPAPPASAPPATAPPTTPLAPPATAPPMSPITAPATTPGAPPAPAGNTRVYFSPSQVDTALSNSITVSLMVDGASDAFSAPMQIVFDPRILRLNDITQGDLLSQDGQAPVFTKNIMNDSGAATVQLSRLANTPGVSGSGKLITLNFQAVGRGTTGVTIPNLTIRSSQGAPLASSSPQLTINVK